MKPLHHINKVTLDFTFPQKDKNIALQKAKQLFYDYALKQIENALEETDETIYIDKLEIDLGTITEDDFAEKFSSVLKDALSKYFQKKTNISLNLQTEDKKLLSVDDVMFFLNSGYWPWYIQNRNEKEIYSMFEVFFLSQGNISVILEKLSTSGIIPVHRFIAFIWYEKRLRHIVIKHFVEEHLVFKKKDDFIKNIFEKFNAKPIRLYLIFIQQLFSAAPIVDVKDYKRFVLDFINNAISGITLKTHEQVAINKARLIFEKKNITIQRLFEATEKLFYIINQTPLTISEDRDKVPGLFFKNEDESKIHIDNAGLILLHPFLPMVFKELGWTDAENNFTNTHYQQKAILFLQFIINGKSKQSEHLLVLNKILCGWPVALHLRSRVLFSLAEKNAAADILDSLIEHWSVLRNTSRNGLVTSFINRKGLIEKTIDGFVVQVEKNSIDILLDSLPFGINTIKLPWNEYFIYTEWRF